jgi:colanic acid biosynthesis glycosyl transferase WcaI
MRVLIFTQYFPPEIGATQARLHSFAAGLAERGHDVEVVCEMPNHPQGVVHPGYGGRLVERRTLDGFRVNYVWVRTSKTKTPRSRLVFYGSYAASAAVVGVARKRPDVVFASSPPLPVAVAAAAVAARHRVPWVLDVRDLWPDAAVAMGELSEGRALHAAEWLERRLYTSAAAITTVTEPFVRAIAANVDDPEKITLVPNGTTQFWLDAARLEPDRAALGLPEDRFVWTFAGNVGKAQGLEAAIDAAALLGDNFRLVSLGNGPARAALEERARLASPGCVLFRDQVPPSVAAEYLRASDALLVSLAADEKLRSFVPSKLYDCFAVGRPVIVAAAGEAARLADEASAAVTVAPDSPNALAYAVRRLQADPQLGDELPARARRFAMRHDRARHVEVLDRLLRHVVGGEDAQAWPGEVPPA